MYLDLNITLEGNGKRLTNLEGPGTSAGLLCDPTLMLGLKDSFQKESNSKRAIHTLEGLP